MGGPLEGGGFILDTPEEIEMFRYLVAWQGLVMEATLRLDKYNGVSSYRWVKRNIGLKGNKKTVLRLYENWLVENGVVDADHMQEMSDVRSELAPNASKLEDHA